MTNKVECTLFFVIFSLNSITCSGSLGIISARYLEHPFETSAKVKLFIGKENLFNLIFFITIKKNDFIFVISTTTIF